MDGDELLRRENDAWAALSDVIVAVPPDRRQLEGAVPGWSIHDLVWHCAYWAAWASDVMECLHRDEPIPVEPEDEAAFDVEVLAEGRAMTWEDAVRQLEENHDRARRALSAFSEPPELAVQWFTENTFEHFDEHAAQIRAFST